MTDFIATLFLIVVITFMIYKVMKLNGVKPKQFMAYIGMIFVFIIIDALDLFGDNFELYSLLIFTISGQAYDYLRVNNKDDYVTRVYHKMLRKYEYKKDKDEVNKYFYYRKKQIEENYDRKTRSNIISFYISSALLVILYRFSVSIVDQPNFDRKDLMQVIPYFFNSIEDYLTFNSQRAFDIFSYALFSLILLLAFTIILWIIIHIGISLYKKRKIKSKK